MQAHVVSGWLACSSGQHKMQAYWQAEGRAPGANVVTFLPAALIENLL